MEKRVEYSIDQENKIINRCFCGKINLQDNIDSWNELFENVDFSTINGVLNDFTKAELTMELDEIYILLKFLNEKLLNLSKVKLAVISLKPEIIVFPTLAQNDFPNLKIRPFSTREAALNWLIN